MSRLVVVGDPDQRPEMKSFDPNALYLSQVVEKKQVVRAPSAKEAQMVIHHLKAERAVNWSSVRSGVARMITNLDKLIGE